MRTAEQLGKILAEMYDNALRMEQVTMIHLFGVKYSSEIKNVGIKAVVDASGIHSTYKSEVSKGVKLAKYVREI
jgi:hypothetical protein